MIELIAYEQKSSLATDVVGDQWTLDITQPGGVSLNYEVSKGEDVMGRYSPFSQTFRLPFTNHNSRFFGLYYDVNLTSAGGDTVFNIHTKTICEIRVDGIPIITGSLQLKNVHTKSQEYEVAVFGEEANIFQEIKDKKLVDLFINATGVMDVDYDVPLTGANIYNSWNLAQDVTNGSVGAGVVTFPLADYGLAGEGNFLYYQNDDQDQSGMATANFLQPYMFKPAIKVSHLFEKVFTNAGYTLKSNSFLTSDAWTKLYMTLASDRESVATRGVLGLCVSHDGTGVDPIVQINQLASPQNGNWQYITTALTLNDSTGAGVSNNPPALFDIDSNWINNNRFKAPAEGMYYGTVNIAINSNIIANQGCSIRFGVINATNYAGVNSGYDYVVDSNVQSFFGSNISGNSGNATCTPLNWELYLQEGDEVRIFAEGRLFNNAGVTKYLRILPSGTYFTVYASDLVNGVAQMPNNMPDVQQSAFVKDLCQRFNLCIASDSQDHKTLTIQPWQEYLDAGTRKDWTDRLDTSKEFTIKPTDSIRKKFIHFSDAEDDTQANANFQTANNYVVGQYKQEVGQDYTSGTLKNDAIFAPFQVTQIPTSNPSNIYLPDSYIPDVLIHRGYGEDTNGPISSAKPKLFYHNGLKDIENGQYIMIGSGVDQYTKFPLCLPFYNGGDNIDSDSPLLLWQWQPTTGFAHQYFGSTPSNEGYFARYHQQYLMSIYGEEARLVDCQMMLSPTDIFNFAFNDEIIIKNTAYRVLKIGNYQPFANVPSKVTLLKKLDAFKGQNIQQPGEDCTLVYLGLLQNGFVQFTDPDTGTLSYGTEDCCTENGFVWNSTHSACMWATGHGGSGNGFTDGILPDTPVSEGKSKVTNLGGLLTSKSKQTKNFNPLPGEITIQGKNLVSGIPTTQKDFVLYATSYNNTPISASSTGTTATSQGFALGAGMMARVVVRALSIQIDSYSATSGVGSQGSSAFQVFSFMVKNLKETITIVGSEQTDFAQEDTDAGTRSVGVVAQKGTGDTSNVITGFAIQCTGPDNTVCAWNLDCSVTYTSIVGYRPRELEDLLLLENLGDILTEDGLNLEQE